jgi:hypothetical protein
MPATTLPRRSLLALPLLLAGGRDAAALPPPEGRVLLDVTGRIARPNAGEAARLDFALLDSLPQASFETRTPWFDGPRRFSGVAGAALLEALGAGGAEVVAVALNDYRVTIPVEDFRATGLILATRLDGQPIPVREKGPIWIIYPFDAEARLRNQVFYTRSIWQLRRLEFRG